MKNRETTKRTKHKDRIGVGRNKAYQTAAEKQPKNRNRRAEARDMDDIKTVKQDRHI